MTAGREVLLDANVLLSLHDTGTKPLPADVAARFEALLDDDETELFITPLIRYEVLRGIDWGDDERYGTMKAALDALTELDVTREASELAAELFRLYVAEHVDEPGINVDKRRFDAFHFSVAKIRGMELASRDRHMRSLDALYARLMPERGQGKA